MTFIESLNKYKIQLLASLLLLGGLYHSIIISMVQHWSEDPNYSHGFLVPFIAGYFVYQRLDDLKKARVAPSNIGLFIVILGLMILTIAHIGAELFTMRSSLIVVIAGIVIYFFGKDTFGIFMLPIAYLIFMVPLPEVIYNILAFPLKLLVAKYSVLFLDMIGVLVIREGNIIMFPNVTLEVVDACSGLRSIMSLLTLSAAFSFIVKTSNIKKVIIILSAIPIAIFTNSIRVIVTGILAQNWGAEVAEGFFHEFAGLMIFLLAVIILLVIVVALREKGK